MFFKLSDQDPGLKGNEWKQEIINLVVEVLINVVLKQEGQCEVVCNITLRPFVTYNYFHSPNCPGAEYVSERK